MSVNGQDYRSNVYLLDGTLQNDFTNGPAGSAAGTTLGMESIREFRVESNAYSAEFGRNFGGQINVLTKSGTNTLRGSAYEFHRNDALDAANYFDVAGKPDFTRNQFGGAARRPAGRTIGCSTSSATKRCARTSARRSRASSRTTTRASASCPTARSTISRRRPAVPGRDSARQRPVDRRRPRARTRFTFDQTRRPGLLPGAPRPSGRRGAPVLRAAIPTTMASSGCRPTTRSSRARSSRRTSSRPSSTATSSRRGRCRRCASATAARASARTSRPTSPPPLPPFVAGRDLVGDIDIGGMQRFGPQTLGQPAAGAERLQRPVRHHAHARAAPAEGRSCSPSTTATS